MRPGLILHVPLHMMASDGADLPGFFQKIRSGFLARGAHVEVRWRDIEALTNMGDTGDIHLVHNGRIRHPRVLNTGLAYIYPFWYCDPHGIFGDSSLAAETFRPDDVDPALANVFLMHQTRRLVDRRQSRYDQPQDRRTFPKNAIAVFLQGDSDPVNRARYMSEREMFSAVLASRGDRTVILKPHPRNLTGDTAHILAVAGQSPGVVITDANVHDILASSDVTVTATSATALESMIHRVPVVLCGRSDLHHCAVTIRHPDEMHGALRVATNTPFPFAEFLYWFLAQNTLNAGSATLIDDTLARMTQHGVDTTGLMPNG
ncbi:hypothetical protein OEZ71_03320 [Defluviimonas sp. WL0050]|uniref:Capsule polysaccharide biosynthesis protein n=1 Tax=Albidovulum litorale TaxID=2984134 RepID=A0ABT2ZJL2_9RHOB|nr:hypothetical protein [Defluviimonas sp. WL0050]MCV2871320.1 hypothetical protein [Defluviimonas sp. WL0050]